MTSKDDLKARLMAEAEAAIEQMLVEREQQGRLTISDIERLARSVGQTLMQDISQELADEESGQAESRMCPKCGHKMRDKGRKERNIISETGTIRVERAYYYCETCREGVFPPR